MKNNGRLSLILRLVGIAAGGAIAVGGWCYALGQRTNDSTIEKQVQQNAQGLQVLQTRFDERWDRILSEMERMNTTLEEIRRKQGS